MKRLIVTPSLLISLLLSVSVRGAALAATPTSISAKIHASAERVYRGQVFQLTLSVRHVGVRLSSRVSYSALFDDPLLQKLENFRELVPEKKMIGSRLAETRRFVCNVRAKDVGTINIAPTIHLARLERRNSFFGPRWTDVPVDVNPTPLQLSVLDLPEKDRPLNFSGAVGRFNFRAEAAPLDVAVGDLIKIQMRIHGVGYLPGIRPPRVAKGPHFKVYDPERTSKQDARELVFEQTLVPQSKAATMIPAIPFTYFDPLEKKYKSITQGPFRVAFHEPEQISDDGGSPSVTVLSEGSAATADSARKGFWGAVLARAESIWSAWREGLVGRPHATLARHESARLAPAYSALESFSVQKGVSVRLLDSHDDWVKIFSNGNRGWLPKNALE